MSFKISSIEIVHPDKSLTSKIEFSDGLTVIHGNSNSGKSLVFVCIDHIFGRKIEKEKSKFPMDMGYTDIVMRIKHDSGKMVVVSRPIDSNIFEVTSDIPQIESGTYGIQASKTRRPIFDVFLKLIGFEEPEVYKVVKNQSKLTGASLTWRTFQQLFVLDENSVHTEEPVLLRGEKTARTKVKSALITLLTDTNFDELVSEGGAEKERLKNEGTLRYLKQEQQYLKRQLDEDAEWLNDDDSILDEELYEALLEDAESLQSKINSIVESINQLNQSKANEQARLIELSTYIGHYEELESIYSSKLVRFSAIRRYAQEASHVDKHHLCPVCEQEVPDELEDEISLPDETESETYAQRLTDLRVVLKANKAEKAEVEEKLAQINSSITELNDVLVKGLRPQYQSINQSMRLFITILTKIIVSCCTNRGLIGFIFWKMRF